MKKTKKNLHIVGVSAGSTRRWCRERNESMWKTRTGHPVSSSRKETCSQWRTRCTLSKKREKLRRACNSESTDFGASRLTTLKSMGIKRVAPARLLPACESLGHCPNHPPRRLSKLPMKSAASMSRRADNMVRRETKSNAPDPSTVHSFKSVSACGMWVTHSVPACAVVFSTRLENSRVVVRTIPAHMITKQLPEQFLQVKRMGR